MCPEDFDIIHLWIRETMKEFCKSTNENDKIAQIGPLEMDLLRLC